MARKLIFNPSVPEDLAAALDHYDKISPDLGNRFRTSVDRRLDDIAERPESFPVDIPPVRFAKIDRFPYLVFFSLKANYLSVIAIVHGSWEPSSWRDRA